MALRFINGTDQPVQVAIQWFDASCGATTDRQWRKRGWYRIDPGATGTVFGGDLRHFNKVWYYYAETTDQRWAWTSRDFAECLPWSVFDWCNECNTHSRNIGMVETVVGSGVTHKNITLIK